VSAEATYQALRGHLAHLRLQAAAEALPAELDHARQAGLTHTAFLERLLAIEVQASLERRRSLLERFAKLPAPWTLADFDFDAQPGVDRKLVEDLATLRFLDDATNLLMIGPPGVGKTMLAICLARLGVEAGHRVLFTTAADLAARCQRAALEGNWEQVMRFYANPRLLVVDELGYLPLAREGSAALFQVVSRRYMRGSVCLTTNLGVGQWAQAFGDDSSVAGAMLDRLLHRSVVMAISGESYRMRAHRARAERLRGGQK
jgi:DNA replication protein DnaC